MAVEAGGKTQEQIAKEFGLNHQSQVANYVRKKKEIIADFESFANPKKRSLKKAKYPELDDDLVAFVNDINSRGGNVTTAIVQERALELAAYYQIPVSDFGATNGFIANFFKRHRIKSEISHGDASSVDPTIVQEWKEKALPLHVKNYAPNNVFNFDELGLFYQLLPNRTLAVKGSSFRKGKNSKVRVTLLLGANMSGTEKAKPLLIGKAATPRGFPLNKKKMAVYYAANKTSWMTSALFVEYMSRWNKELVKENRKVLVFIDNCPAHPQAMRFANIKIVFLPKNTTSVLQPMDMGIIKTFKTFYRKQVVKKIVNELVSENAVSADDVKIPLIEAVRYMKIAWDNVSLTTIRNCFRKAGFEMEMCDDAEEEIPDDGEYNQLPEEFIRGISFDDFVNCDNDVCVAESTESTTQVNPTGESVDEVQEEMEETSDHEDVEEIIKVLPSFKETYDAISIVEAMADLDIDKNSKLLIALDSFKSELVKEKIASKTQSKITDYFAKK